MTNEHEMTPADILEITADRFESGEYRWRKGEFIGSVDDSMCSLGALMATKASVDEVRKAFGPPRLKPSDFEIFRMRSRLLGETIEARRALHQIIGIEIATWNDNPFRTREEVVETMKQAAKNLRNRA